MLENSLFKIGSGTNLFRLAGVVNNIVVKAVISKSRSKIGNRKNNRFFSILYIIIALMTRRVFKQNFFNQPTVKVAKNLLGKFLCHRIGKKVISKMITEVEAYDGFSDKASHASRGKTARNAVMFGASGIWYVYFTYGMHWMLNIVVGPKDYPAAILIRGVEGINGPARLTKFLRIDKKFNTRPAVRKTGLWIEGRGVKIPSNKIKAASRIGVAYSSPVWSKKKWRFYLGQTNK